MRTRWYARQAMLAVALFTIAGCGADSCSCSGFEPGEFPVEKVDKTIVTSGEVRLTPTGLTFLEDNLPAILASFLPGGLNFCVPPTSTSGLTVCGDSQCMSGEDGCDMSLTLDDAQLTPEAPNKLNIALTIGGLDETLDFRAGSDCELKLFSKADRNLPATIGATLPVTFEVDQSSPFKDVSVVVGELGINTDNVDYDIDGKDFWDIPICELVDGIAAIGAVRNLLFDQLTGQFEPIITEQVDALLCQSCDGGCPDQTTCDGNNLCRYQDDTCPQNPLGLSGELVLGDLLADYIENPEASVDMTVRVADHAVANDGITLGLRSGYDPVASSICVPADPTVRNFAPTPLSPTLTGNTRPNGTPFQIGIGYHERALESMLWSVWGSGGTCFKVGSDTIDLLSTSSIGALVPSLKELAYNKGSEAFIKIVPQTEPNVILGANTVMPMGNGYEITDPLMTVDWKDFDIHIFAFAQDRFTRVFTIRVDLELPIAVVADGMGSIIPVLGDIEDALKNQRILENELVSEDPQRILDLLPTLLGFALPALAGSLSDPIELPEFFGFRIDIGPGDITSVDNNTSIAIFADLQIVATPYIQHLETNVGGWELDLSRRTEGGLVRPQVKVQMLGPLQLATSAEPVEYTFRVDGGTWSLPVRSNELLIDSPTLVLPGEHRIEVRSQRVGDPYSADRTPAVIDVMVDWEAPSVELDRAGSILTATATDAVDTVEEMSFRWRIVTGEPGARWSEWASSPTLDLSELDLPVRFRVQVEARDRAGNVSSDEQTVTWRAPLESSDEPSSVPTGGSEVSAQPAAGCNSTGSSGPGGLLILLAFGGLAFGARRRRRFAPVAASMLLAVSACKCGDEPQGQSSLCTPACAEGQACVDGDCVVQIDPQCTVDDDCDAGEECRNGRCFPNPSCESLCDCKEGDVPVCEEGTAGCVCEPACDGGCGDGEFCCFDDNSCKGLPDPCADQMCDPGFQPAVTTDSSGDSATCEIAAGACECEPLPPLPLGFHGHYAAIDRNAGVTAIATYNSTYEDLMVGIVGANNEVDWMFVDGVPTSGDIEGALDGPRGGIKDDGDYVGRFTSLAIDDSGLLHVFYRDEDRGVLKYARGESKGDTYDWTLSDVDLEGDTGYWTSAVYASGKVHVVWQTKAVSETTGWQTKLRHLSFDATGSPADPTAAMVDVATGAARHPCGFDCETRGEECFAGDGVCREPSEDCANTCADGSACWQGSCVATFEEPPVGYTTGIGTNNELSVTPAGDLLLVYWDWTQDSVVWNRFDGAWGQPNVIGAGSGPWASGAVDASNEVHVAWMDSTVTPPVLMYQNVTSGQPEVIVDGIRDTATSWLVADIGSDVNLRLAGSTPTVVFQDEVQHSLRKGTRGANGMWQVSDVAVKGDPFTGSHGFYAAMLKADPEMMVELVINNQLEAPEAAPEFHP